MDMNKAPKISVIVPVYKAEKYLAKCIDSILSQSFTDFELLLIDDGSPDHSGEICDHYAKQDQRIRVFHKKNGGVSSARNLGLKEAKGEWIAFVDSDDWVLEGYLEGLYKGANNMEKVLVVQGTSVYLQEVFQRNVDFETSIVYRANIMDVFSQKELYRHGGPFSKLYNWEVIKMHSIRFLENVVFGEDLLFMCAYLKYVDAVHFISGGNYIYVQQPNGLSQKHGSYESEITTYNIFNKEILALKKIDNSFNMEDKSLKEYSVRFLMRAIHNMYRPASRKERKVRLSILETLGEEDILMIKENYRTPIKTLKLGNYFLGSKHFKTFDTYCTIFFYIRHKLDNLWNIIR